MFGPESGRWSISRSYGRDSDTTETRFYVNISANAIPPETGWTWCSGSMYAPTLVAGDSSPAESTQQEIYELPDVSSLVMTEQQDKLWKFVQELSDLVETHESDKINNKREAIKLRQASLNMLEWSSINRLSVECAELILYKIVTDQI